MPRRRTRKIKCGNGGCTAFVELDGDGARRPCALCIHEGRVLKWDKRYNRAKGKMADFLPGGSKYTGAILHGDAPGREVEEQANAKSSSASAYTQPPISL